MKGQILLGILFLLCTSVLAQPVITSFTPASGPVSTSVTINGSGFSSTPSSNIVYFGATRATVTAGTTTQLTVTVPVGATYQPITVEANGLIAYSQLPFATTYPGWGVIDAGSFVAAANFTAGSLYSISAGDFDGDGKTDMAVADRIGNTVSIFRNTSTGVGSVSYAAKVSYATGTNPNSVTIGDLDGDGKADLAVANSSSNTVSVFRNTSTGIGSASFAAKVDYVTGTTPYSVTIGDLEGDGKSDLAVANYGSNNVSVFRNVSTGVGSVSFAAKVDYSTSAVPCSVSIGDLDGDGKADLAVAASGSAVSIFRNTSTGMGSVSFAAKVDYFTGLGPDYSVSIGDLDGDGKADLAVTNYTGNTVSLLRNTSTGPGLVSFATKVDYTTGTNPYSVSIGDLDGDGKLDLAVANYNSNNVSVFRNNSTGTGSVSFAAKVDYGTGLGPHSVSIGDLDGDGKADLATANYSDSNMSIILHRTGAWQSIASFDPIPLKAYGDPAFSLTATASSGLPVTYSSSNPSVATVSGSTVTIAGFGTTTITASQAGNNYYGYAIPVSQVLAIGPFPSITSFTPASGPVGTLVTITGSGFSSTPSSNIVYFGATKATVIAAATTQLTVTVPVGATYQPITVLTNGLTAYSKLSFVTTYPGWGVIDASAFVSKTDFATGSNPYSVSAGDFDGDGKTDLAVANYAPPSTVSIFRNTSTGTGVVNFATKVNYNTGQIATSVSIGDLDGDGKVDLAVANSGDNTVSVFRNTSAGGSVSFAAKVDCATGIGNYPISASIGDVDGDGKSDLIVINSSGNTVSLFRNTSATGSLSFAAKVDYATISNSTSVSVGDIDGDGKIDLAVANSSGNTISVLRNTSTGMGSMSFASRVDYSTGIAPSSVSIGDLDGDGKSDLVVTNFTSNTVSIFRNMSDIGSVSFASKVDFATGANPRSVSIGDLDGDGKVDLVVGNYTSNSLSVFRNVSTGVGSVSYATKVDYVDYVAGTSTNPRSVSIGDFDGDGKADLVAANFGNSTMSVILHRAGAWQAITSFDPFPLKSYGDAAFSLNAVASSGLPITYNSSNTAVATVSGNTVTIVGYGTTTITASQAGDSYYGFISASQVLAVGPFPAITGFTPASGPVGTSVTINGSGFSSTPANNIVYFGASKAMVTTATATQLTVAVPLGATYQAITVLTNGLIAYSKLPFLTTYPGWGLIDAGSFVSKTDVASITGSYSISAEDFDGDGKTDLAVANYYSSNTVSIFRNTSSGAGIASYAAKIDYTTGTYPRSVSIGDLDGDGKADFAVANYNSNTVSIFRNTSTGLGSVSFSAKVDYATGANPYSVSIGDVDGDGRADLAVANSSGNTVSIFQNTSHAGVISFATKVDYTTGTAPYSVTIGDLDGDGKADLAVADYGGNAVSIFKNSSTGMGSVNFSTKIDYVTGSYPYSVSIGDLDGDGKADLAVADYGSAAVSILRNTSSGGSVSFAAKVDYATGTNPFSVSIGDLDGDGKVDLAVANYSSNTVSILRNTSTGAGSVSYATKVDYATGANPYSVSIGDFDRDGKSDLATANPGNATLSVILHKADQTITFNALPTLNSGDPAYTLNATASSGLPISYTSSDASVATVSGNTLTIVGAGAATITASQAGNANYTAAPTVSQTLTVSKASQTITFNAVTPTYGDAPLTLTATASSGLPVTYSSNNPSVATINGNLLTIVGTGVVTITASQAGNSNFRAAADVSQTITINSNAKSIIDQWAFQYRYDGRKRMTAKKVPGADWVYMVYDDRDRLVLTQDGNQRLNNQWTFTKYDVLNRPIMTGVKDTTVVLTQAQMQGVVDTYYSLITTTKPWRKYGETFVGGTGTNIVHGYTNYAYPQVTTAAALDDNKYLTITYYDNYSFRSLWTGTYTYLNDHLSETVNSIVYNQFATENLYVVGKVTGSKTKALDGGTTGSTWLKSIIYYDDKYRAIQTIADNYKGGADRMSNLYDFVGKVLATKTTHATSTHADQIVARSFDYDHVGRLLNTWHSVNGATPVLLVKNEYNELGQLVDKKLHSTVSTGADAKQSIDYRYNIRGWLQSMNNSQLTVNSANNDDTNDLFGMELGYNNSIDTGNGSLFNGNISAMKWSTNLALGTVKDVAYNYSYDPLNRIIGASYQSNTSGVWANAAGAFNESSYSYDLNGNIQNLIRNGSAGSPMDNMTYTYNGNQLLNVADASDKTKGFIDGANTGNDYTYDVNGNMITDQNKLLTAANAIQYNYLNLPQQVTKSTNEKIIYTYDASGRKLRQQVYNTSGTLTKTTDYVGEYIYQNDTLQFINHEEGRVVMKPLSPGEVGVRPEYQYHLKDHLGNVRLTFTTQPVTETPMATFETANYNVEQSQFLRMDDARVINHRLFDHTYDNQTPPVEGAFSERLSGSENEKTGIVRSISVMPGDVINLTVYAKYVDASNNNDVGLTQLLAQIVAGTASAGTVIDGTNYSTNGTTPFPYTGAAGEGNDSGLGPKAYMNYITSDRDGNPIKINGQLDITQSNFVRVSEAAKEDGKTNLPEGKPHEKLTAQIVVKQAGYMYIWLSNEETSPVEVYFDDFTVQQIKSPVVQQEDFYPFGLKFNSFARENSVPNTIKLFQGQEHIDDLGLNWDSFKWRNHQPDIGRFFNIDPLAHKYVYNSPYAFSENKVVAHVELEGLESFAIASLNFNFGNGNGFKLPQITFGVQQPVPSFNGLNVSGQVTLNTFNGNISTKIGVSQSVPAGNTEITNTISVTKSEGGKPTLGLETEAKVDPNEQSAGGQSNFKAMDNLKTVNSLASPVEGNNDKPEAKPMGTFNAQPNLDGLKAPVPSLDKFVQKILSVIVTTSGGAK